MIEVFQAVPVTDGVFWVGGIDWSVRDFHGYLTSLGTTYMAGLNSTAGINCSTLTATNGVASYSTNKLASAQYSGTGITNNLPVNIALIGCFHMVLLIA